MGQPKAKGGGRGRAVASNDLVGSGMANARGSQKTGRSNRDAAETQSKHKPKPATVPIRGKKVDKSKSKMVSDDDEEEDD
jgi:hypothetical protein